MRNFFATLAALLVLGSQASAADILGNATATPMTAAEMDAVQGKVGSWVIAQALAQQGLGAFATFEQPGGQQGTVFMTFYDGTPGQAGFVLFPAGNSATVSVVGVGTVLTIIGQ